MTDTKLKAYERRIWRLAYLLTGDPAGAAALVDRVLRAQAEPLGLEPARLDRLVILQARQAPRPTGPVPATTPRALAAAAALPSQPREAWVLTHIDGVDPVWMSRAMDCSRTAATHHLTAAEQQMRAAIPEGLDAAIAELRARVDALDPAAFIEGHRERVRRRRARRLALTGALVAMTILAAALVWLRTRP